MVKASPARGQKKVSLPRRCPCRESRIVWNICGVSFTCVEYRNCWEIILHHFFHRILHTRKMCERIRQKIVFPDAAKLSGNCWHHFKFRDVTNSDSVVQPRAAPFRANVAPHRSVITNSREIRSQRMAPPLATPHAPPPKGRGRQRVGHRIARFTMTTAGCEISDACRCSGRPPSAFPPVEEPMPAWQSHFQVCGGATVGSPRLYDARVQGSVLDKDTAISVARSERCQVSRPAQLDPTQHRPRGYSMGGGQSQDVGVSLVDGNAPIACARCTHSSLSRHLHVRLAS
jgi:hypothetical protein